MELGRDKVSIYTRVLQLRRQGCECPGTVGLRGLPAARLALSGGSGILGVGCSELGGEPSSLSSQVPQQLLLQEKQKWKTQAQRSPEAGSKTCHGPARSLSSSQGPLPHNLVGGAHPLLGLELPAPFLCAAEM